MNAKHLRVGNLIMDSPVNGDGIKKVEALYLNVVFCEDYSHIFNDEIRGIPLTEELLFRFGFVDFEKGSFSYYIENNGEIVFKKSGLDILYDYPIQYVHQLQNLFFSLCGKELSLTN